MLTGSLRRAGNRLRINAQLVDTHTDSLVWSERYDREMKDVFEVQDEIARKIAEALRITLSPQEQEALAAKPTENLQAYDLYLRGKSYARRLTRQDLGVRAADVRERGRASTRTSRSRTPRSPTSAPQYHYHFEREPGLDRAGQGRERSARAPCGPDSPEVQVAEAWILYAEAKYDEAVRARPAGDRDEARLRGRLLPAGPRAVRRRAATRRWPTWRRRRWPRPARTTTSTCRSSTRSGRSARRRRRGTSRCRACRCSRTTSRRSPRTRARACCSRATTRTMDGVDDALREANLAMALRPNEATVLYNVACVFCLLNRKAEAIDALRKAWNAGSGPDWARRDPDLALLHGDPEFEQLYPRETTTNP